MDHLKDLKYINAVLRETLRLTPTAPAFARRVRDENKEHPPTLGKGEYVLERDWTILCLISKIQKDPKVYGEDANDFRPERMLDEEFEKLPKAAWKVRVTVSQFCKSTLTYCSHSERVYEHVSAALLPGKRHYLLQRCYFRISTSGWMIPAMRCKSKPT